MPINTNGAWDFGTWIPVLSVAGLSPAGVTFLMEQYLNTKAFSHKDIGHFNWILETIANY